MTMHPPRLLSAALIACICTAALAQQAPPTSRIGAAKMSVTMAKCGHCVTVQEVKRALRKGEGGALGMAGNDVQKHPTRKKVWVTTVKLHDGSTRKFEQVARPSWAAGSIIALTDKGLSDTP